ncbi:CFF_collapsed_G0044790.mRNA.1.CDS.1 [Saccharomyces cerevisiae]|nr:CFF_collapsed_G0044790.mRNA.1.CDS.1 [Saccharomyces cerevisiae]
MATYGPRIQLLSFGCGSPSYGRKSLERRHGRFGNGTNGDYPQKATTTTTTADEKVAVHKNPYLESSTGPQTNFSILMGLLLRKRDSGRDGHAANVVKCY